MAKMPSVRRSISEENFRRLVDKHGGFHVSLEKIKNTHRFRRYVADCFTTLIDVKWRWTFFIITVGFLLTWMVFGSFYFLFGYVHGDISDTLPPDFKPCVDNVYSFTTALLFSVESQHTIGYGFRAVSDQCPHVITAVFFQFIIGVGVQCVIAGIFFAKLQRGKKRSETVLFSRMACISKFNGRSYLTLRVGNLRSSLILGVRAMGILIKTRRTGDGDEIPLTQHHIDFFTESQSSWINLCWPAIIYHPIDEKSPLRNVSRDETLSGYSELIVVLEGVIDSTSKAFQARTSYLRYEVFYGLRFKSMAPVLHSEHGFQLSYLEFDSVVPTELRPKPRAHVSDTCCHTIGRVNTDNRPKEALRSWKSWNDINKNEEKCSMETEAQTGLPSIVVTKPPDKLIPPSEAIYCGEDVGENNNVNTLSVSRCNLITKQPSPDETCLKKAPSGTKLFKVTKLDEGFFQ